MDKDVQIDLESLRRRFPWTGLAGIDDPTLSSRYRQIMAEARRNREIVEAIEVTVRTG